MPDEGSSVTPPHFIYVVETDLSVNNGPGINEREFVEAITSRWPEDVTCVAPEPVNPDTYRNARVCYVRGHGRTALGYPGYLRATLKQVRRLVAAREPAAVAFRFGATPLLPYVVSRTPSTPVILKTFVPNAALGPKMRQGPLRRGLSRLLAPAYRSVVRSAVAGDTVSVPYRDWICERFDIAPDKITVIPNAANTSTFSPGDTERSRHAVGLGRFERVIGYVGRLNAIRYVDVLIRSLAFLDKDARTGLVLVGAGEERVALEHLARRMGFEDQVVFAGSVPYTSVPEFVRSFDVAVDLTGVEMEIGGRTVLSSFSQKIPQYLACGVPVVAWDCVDTEFLVDEKVGAVVAFRDEAELGLVIRSLLARDDQEVRATRDRARSLVESRLSTVTVAGERLRWWRSVVD